MADNSNDPPQDAGSSSAALEAESPATPQQPQDAAADAMRQLSLSADSPVLNGDGASEFDPKPLTMSRGDSGMSSGSLEEDIQCSMTCSRPDRNKETPPGKQQAQRTTRTSSTTNQQEAGAFVTPRRTTANGIHNRDKIILTANHQNRLSSRIVTADGAQQHQRQDKPSSYRNRQKTAANNNQDTTATSGGSNSDDKNVLFAPIVGAWGWIQKQNEKKKQQHLKLLAEQQVQKLKQAQKKDPSIHYIVVEEESPSTSAAFATPPHSSQQLHLSADDSFSNREDEDDISWIPAVRVVEEQVKKDFTPSPRSAGTGTVTDPTKPIPLLLNDEQMHDIARYVLPKGIAFCRWKRLYSLTRDGDSFSQCLRLCGSEPKTLLVIKTTRGAVFGGYADAPWELKSSHASGAFHGSASACLFSFSIPDDNATNTSTSTDQQQPTANGTNHHHDKSKATKATTEAKPSTNLTVFHWTGANRYIQYTDTTEARRMLAFGGGGQEGSFGLCVEQDFQKGSTGPCDTFGNLPLCDQENFNVMDMEIWGFLTGQF